MLFFMVTMARCQQTPEQEYVATPVVLSFQKVIGRPARVHDRQIMGRRYNLVSRPQHMHVLLSSQCLFLAGMRVQITSEAHKLSLHNEHAVEDTSL